MYIMIIINIIYNILCFNLLTNFYNDKSIKIGQIKNEIRVGDLAGNRNLEFGIKNILEELILDNGYDLSDKADITINVNIVFFDIVNLNKNIGVYHKNNTITRIIIVGEVVENNKIIKKAKGIGESQEISTSTLIIGDNGGFNQQTASIAIKKVCENLINELL